MLCQSLLKTLVLRTQLDSITPYWCNLENLLHILCNTAAHRPLVGLSVGHIKPPEEQRKSKTRKATEVLYYSC